MDEPTIAEPGRSSAARPSAAPSGIALPTGGPSPTGPSHAHTSPTALETTLRAMRLEEAARASIFSRVTAALCAVALGVQFYNQGDPTLHTATTVALIALGIGSIVVWRRARDPRTYTPALFRFFALLAALCAIVFVNYIGVFSVVTTVVVLGFSFFATSEDAKFVVPVCMAVVIGIVISALLVTFGVVPEVSVIVPRDLPTSNRLGIIVVTASLMVLQIVQARMARRATIEAIARTNDAVRLARTREAQLEEAKEHLDAALRAGVAVGGRFSGAAVGRWMVEHLVGRGAMGEVYAARSDQGRRSAVKVLRLATVDDPAVLQRFMREAEIAARMRGPNLVEVLEIGRASDGSPFIAMELLEGMDLATLLRERDRLPLGEVVTLATDVARGLAVLHAAGVIHRDLKPQNVFLVRGPPPSWKILDYGVSKLTGGGTITENQVVGTPSYMSPEQAEGRTVDERSDVFSLGALVYRTLTGRRAFAGGGTPEILYQVVYGAPARPRELVPSLPRDVELVLALALAKRPDDRFPTASSFARALDQASRGELDPQIRAQGERIARLESWARTDSHAAVRAAR